MKYEIELVIYNRFFLELSWIWLHDEEIKRLTHTLDFSKNEQLAWYNSLQLKKDYYIWGIMYEKCAIGACGIKNISNDSGEYWGYIGAKKLWGKGLGVFIIEEIEKKAKNLNLTELRLKVLKNNIRAFKLYLKNGFTIYIEDEKWILMKKNI